jgi:aryl-alcohol dehydrogenase-like predicted oxidoreductase
MPMQYTMLGDSGPEVSRICLGTMSWGSQVQEEATTHTILDAFVAAGGNFIDTAEMYPVPPSPEWPGRAEEFIGRWLAKNPDVRTKVVIATKVSGPSTRWLHIPNNRPILEDALFDREAAPNFDRGNIRAACAGSLKRLQTSYIDILYVHWPSRPVPLFGSSVYQGSMKNQHPLTENLPYAPVPLEETIKAMAELIAEGKIRHWAISNETSFGVCTIAEVCARLGLPKPVCIQNDFSLLDRRFQYELAEACAPWNHNISGVPYGLMAGGTLSGKYSDPENPPPATVRHKWMPAFQSRYHSSASLAATAKYVELAKAKGLAPAVMALAFGLQCFFNQSVITTFNSLDQLHECLSAVDVTLDADTLKAIDEIHSLNKNPNLTL